MQHEVIKIKYQLKQMCPFMCLNFGEFYSMGLALSKVDFGSLHLFRGWMTLKATKLFPIVVHTGLVGHPDPRPL